MRITDGPDIPTVAGKAMETGGVAIAVIIALIGLMVAITYCTVYVYKNAIRPFMASVADITSANAAMTRDLRHIHDRERYKLTESPSLSAARPRETRG